MLNFFHYIFNYRFTYFTSFTFLAILYFFFTFFFSFQRVSSSFIINSCFSLPSSVIHSYLPPLPGLYFISLSFVIFFYFFLFKVLTTFPWYMRPSSLFFSSTFFPRCPYPWWFTLRLPIPSISFILNVWCMVCSLSLQLIILLCNFRKSLSNFLPSIFF